MLYDLPSELGFCDLVSYTVFPERRGHVALGGGKLPDAPAVTLAIIEELVIILLMLMLTIIVVSMSINNAFH